MNLWYKPIEEIDFNDLNTFLNTGHREGIRLDYKADIPKDLAKLANAFVNTLGGLLVLGVDADPKTNAPVWPPVGVGRGLPAKNGISEQIRQICQENNYPPVMPAVGPVLPNPHNPDHVLVPVRFDPSPYAPHTTADGRHVYERTGDLNKPQHYDHAHIDSIKRLLERRAGMERDREVLIETARARLFPEGIPPLFPAVRWAAVAPLYPWRDVCTKEFCHRIHYGLAFRMVQGFAREGIAAGTSPQSTPHGSYYVLRTPTQNSGIAVGATAFNCRGLVFSAEPAIDKPDSVAEFRETSGCGSNKYLDLNQLFSFLIGVAAVAGEFYDMKEVEYPGPVKVVLGLDKVLNYRMYFGGDYIGRPFLDKFYRAETVVEASRLRDDPEKAMRGMLKDTAFAFDLSRL
jgi:hypothetical protein